MHVRGFLFFSKRLFLSLNPSDVTLLFMFHSNCLFYIKGKRNLNSLVRMEGRKRTRIIQIETVYFLYLLNLCQSHKVSSLLH